MMNGGRMEFPDVGGDVAGDDMVPPQRRENHENPKPHHHHPDGGGDGDGAPAGIKVKVSYGSSFHDVTLPPHSTFGYLKDVLAPEVGLEPIEQRLFFRGREKDDTEVLSTVGVKNLSKLLLKEHPASKERKMEEMKKRNEISKACEAVAEVGAEVDKLSQKVASLASSAEGGLKLDDKEFIVLTELLMVQLLKLDTIDAQGEAKVQRKTEVRRIQSYVDTLDALKGRNLNPISSSNGISMTMTTKWETFDSEVGVSAPSSPLSSSTKITQEWEKFE